MNTQHNKLAEEPLVSVAIPCYNHAEFVQETIQSIIDQNYYNIELIIIDDGSKDNSVEKIEEMVDACKGRFKRFEFKCRPNKGLSATLNEMIEWSSGKYFSACASDDILYPNATSSCVSLLEKRRDCGMCHAHAESINGVPDTSSTNSTDKEFTFEQLINRNKISALTVVVRKDVFNEVGVFDESLLIEDWDMWLRISHAGYKIGFVNEVVAFYRYHENNLSKDLGRMELASDQILSKWRESIHYKNALINEKIRRFYFYSDSDKKRALIYLKIALLHINNYYSFFGMIKFLLPSFAVRIIMHTILFLRKNLKL